MPEAERIASRRNPLVVALRRLAHDAGSTRRMGECWIEGGHLCAAAAARGLHARLAVLTEAGWDDPASRRLAAAAARIVVVPEALMGAVSALSSASAIAFVVALPNAGEVRQGTASIVLDRLQDAGNVGAVLRSAAAFGVRQVIALAGTAALWSPKVLRAGMGAHFGLHLVEGAGESELAALGTPLLCTSSHAALALHEAALPWPCAWVFGHEGQGVSAALQQRCGQTLRIAQPGGEESLNVAAAAAVCLYESARQRGFAPPG